MSDDIVDLLLVTIPIEASQQEYLTFEQVVMRDAADEIKRLREVGDWLWEAMSRHDNTRECPQCQDMIQAWKAVRGGQ